MKVSIHDLAGRRVVTLDRGATARDRRVLARRGLDERGAGVPSGMRWIRARGVGGSRAHARVALVR